MKPHLACRHVIIETNNTTARIFPAVPDCETPEFWDKMERLIVLNKRLIAVGQSDAPQAVKTLQKVRTLPWPPCVLAHAISEHSVSLLITMRTERSAAAKCCRHVTLGQMLHSAFVMDWITRRVVRHRQPVRHPLVLYFRYSIC